MRKSVKVITAAVLTVGISTTGGFQVYKNFEELKEENRQLHNEVVLKNEVIHKQKYSIKQLNTKNTSLQTQLKVKQSVIDKLTKNINEKDRSINSLKMQLEKAKKRNDSPRNQMSSNGKSLKTMTMELSFYTNHPSENGTYGGKVVTKSGYDISNTIKYQGMGIVASSNSELPLYSIIEIKDLGKFIVLDSGSAISSGKLDVLVGSKEEAKRKGRYTTTVNILRIGKG